MGRMRRKQSRNCWGALGVAYILVLHAIIGAYSGIALAAIGPSGTVAVICSPNGTQLTQIPDPQNRSSNVDHGIECCIQTCSTGQVALLSCAAISNDARDISSVLPGRDPSFTPGGRPDACTQHPRAPPIAISL